MANSTLFQFGPVLFRVMPLNINQYEIVTTTEYARKPVLNSIPQREWVGEGDEEVVLSGMVFPKRIGGFANLEQLDAMRLNATAQPLIRGAAVGTMLGWFVCEHLERRHNFLNSDGIGQTIIWQAAFSRCDQPSAADYPLSIQKTLPSR